MKEVSKDNKILSLSRYLLKKYNNIINERINQEKKAIKESDDYKERKLALFTALTSIIGDSYIKENEDWRIENMLNHRYPLLNTGLYELSQEVDRKLDAILYTLPEDLTLEQVEETVNSKLGFEEMYRNAFLQISSDNDEETCDICEE